MYVDVARVLIFSRGYFFQSFCINILHKVNIWFLGRACLFRYKITKFYLYNLTVLINFCESWLSLQLYMTITLVNFNYFQIFLLDYFIKPSSLCVSYDTLLYVTQT